MKKLFFYFILLFFISGCSNSDSENGHISYIRAKELIINNGATLIDTRTSNEYNKSHIDGAINLDCSNVDLNSASEVIDNINSIIIVYADDNKKSDENFQKLKELGYTNIFNLGSIKNWKN